MMEFLIILGIIWLIIASYNDVKSTEIPNWLSFSLIIFGLGYRLIFSILNQDFNFLLFGLFGFGVFFILGNLFYYSRLFAGGDAKFLMGLGVVIPFSSSFIGNLLWLIIFVFLFLFLGGFYGLVYSIVLSVKKEGFVREFMKELKLWKKKILFVSLLSLFLLIVLYYFNPVLFLLPVILFISPYLFVFGRAVENSCMVKIKRGRDLREGDWLNKEVKIGKKVLKPSWEGLSKEDIKLLKNRKVEVKEGIPFLPAFLLAYLVFVYLWYSSFNLWQFF